MKKDIHPPLFLKAKTTCTGCRTVFTIPSTAEVQQIEICSHCHPVYIGRARIVSSGGRVDRFRRKQETAKVKGTSAPKKERKLTPEERLEKKLAAKRKEKARPILRRASTVAIRLGASLGEAEPRRTAESRREALVDKSADRSADRQDKLRPSGRSGVEAKKAEKTAKPYKAKKVKMVEKKGKK